MRDKKKIVTGEYTKTRKQRRNLAKFNMKIEGYTKICKHDGNRVKCKIKGREFKIRSSLFAKNWRRECYINSSK